MDLQKNIFRLTEYGIRKNLIEEADRTYIINQFLMAFDEKEFSVSGEEAQEMKKEEIVLAQLLDALTDEAVSRGMIEGGITERDLFDTKLMGILTARPSEIIAKFQKKYEENPVEATDYFYEFSQDTNYIRRDRIQKDRSWKADSPYGEIDITINLSKPEKDPKAIAAAKNAPQTSYPKEQLSCLPALRGKRRLCRQTGSSRKTEPAYHPSGNSGQSVGLPVFSLRVL